MCSVKRNSEQQSKEALPGDIETQKEGGGKYERKTSYLDGLVHMFRATIGTGILGLPLAFSLAGYVTGVIGTIFVSYTSLYAGRVMARTQLILSKKDKNMVPTYQGSVEAAFAHGPTKFRSLAPYFVKSTNVLLLIGQVGVCVYFVFIAANLKAVMDPYVQWDIRLWTLIVSVPLLALGMIDSLKRLSLVSSLGNSVILACVGIIVFYIFKEPLSLNNRNAFGKLEDLPQFFGTVLYACGYLNMIMPLQSEMANPEDLGRRFGVLDMNAMISCVVYVLFGLLGYLRYGDDAKGTVTLNLPEETVGTAVKVLLALSVMSATVLQNYITMSIVWEDYLEKTVTRNKVAVQYLLRIAIVLVSVVISVTVPNLELLVSVFGIFGQVFLNAGLPVIIHTLTCYEQDSAWDYIREFWMDVVNVLFSLFILITSLNTVVLQLIDYYKL